MNLNILNICLSAFMGMLCLVSFLRLTSRGDKAFAVCWGAQWLLLAVVYALFEFTGRELQPQYYWVMQCVDMIGNALLLIAAFALYKGAKFSFSKELDYVIVLFALLTILSALGGMVSSRTLVPSWHVFVMAPSQLLASAGFVALGIAGGARFPDFRVPIYVLCVFYALIQVPAYYTLFIEPVANIYYAERYVHAAREINPAVATQLESAVRAGAVISERASSLLKGLLASGKAVFVVYALLILKSNGTEYVKTVSTGLTVISMLLTFASIVLKIYYLP
jgi:hypothetical protein